MSEHAQSVLDENVSLLKQQELLREQMKEMKGQHQAIGKSYGSRYVISKTHMYHVQFFCIIRVVSQLNSEISKGKRELEDVEKKLNSLQENHSQLQTQFEQLVQHSAHQVSIDEHQSALKEMHG